MTHTSSQGQNTWCLLLAAGSGTRLQAHTEGCPKQFLHYQGQPLYLHTARIFARYAGIQGIIFVFPQEVVEQEKARLTSLEHSHSLGLHWKAVAGGVRRQDSVYCALKALPPECSHVLVHDSARPFVTPSLIASVHTALMEGAEGVVPALSLVDTIKEVRENTVINTPERHHFVSVQTPQGFNRALLESVHERALEEGFAVTDDASMLEKCGHTVHIVPGERENCKITHEQDLMKLHTAPAEQFCSGFGYDVHRFAKPKDAPTGKERPLKLGGVPMAGNMQVLAHSDGDVLLHALMDAMLGAAALGDIGLHFPDTSSTFESADSAVLLQEVLRLISAAGVRLQHVDLTIITQKPKVGPQRSAIQKSVAHLLALPLTSVNVKATTEEGLGFTGEGAGIKAVALVNGLRTIAP